MSGFRKNIRKNTNNYHFHSNSDALRPAGPSRAVQFLETKLSGISTSA